MKSKKSSLPPVVKYTADTQTSGMNYVYMFRNVDLLTNLLWSISLYKKYVGQAWPRAVGVKARSRFCYIPLGFGDSTEIIVKSSYRIPYALHLLMYDPIPDVHGGSRTPTEFPHTREPIIDNERLYNRLRSDFNPLII